MRLRILAGGACRGKQLGDMKLTEQNGLPLAAVQKQGGVTKQCDQLFNDFIFSILVLSAVRNSRRSVSGSEYLSQS